MKKETKGKRIKKIRRIVTLAFIACVMSTCSVFSLGTSATSSVVKQANAQLNIASEASYSKGFKLKWNRVKSINGKKVVGYVIRYADKKDSKSSYGSWKTLLEINNNSKKKYYYSDFSLKSGQEREYKIYAITDKWVAISGILHYRHGVVNKISSIDYDEENNSVTLTWSAISGCLNYQVERSTTGNDSDYKRICGSAQPVKKGDTTVSYTDNSNLKAGATYYYRVRGYKKVGNFKYVSKTWTVKTVTVPLISAPTITSASLDKASSTYSLTLSKVNKAEKYEVVLKDSKNNTIETKETTNENLTLSFDTSNLKAESKYTVTVRSYNSSLGFSSSVSKSFTMPKEPVDFTISAPTVGDVTYYADCTSTDCTDSTINLMFVGETRDISIFDISDSSSQLDLDDYNIEYDDSAFEVTKNSNTFSVTPLTTTSSSTIKITSNNGKFSHEYSCEVIQPICESSYLNSAVGYTASDGVGGFISGGYTKDQSQFQKDTVLYCYTQIVNNYSTWLSNEGIADTEYSKVLYAFRVVSMCGIDNQKYDKPYYVLYEHCGDCTSFARTFDTILKLFGFSAEQRLCGFTNGTHIYNIVVLDGQRYKVDTSPYEGVTARRTLSTMDYKRFLTGGSGTQEASYGCNKPYYGFACSTQAEYDEAVTKVKAEFKSAIEDLNKSKGYSLNVVDKLPSKAKYITYMEVEVETGLTTDLTSDKETILQYLQYDIDWSINNGYIYIDDNVSFSDSSTSYNSKGAITYSIYYATNDEKLANAKLKLKITNDKVEVIYNNSSSETSEVVDEEVSSEVTEEVAEETSEVTEESSEVSEVEKTEESSETEITEEEVSEVEPTDESSSEEEINNN